jgi:hypothetical protein
VEGISIIVANAPLDSELAGPRRYQEGGVVIMTAEQLNLQLKPIGAILNLPSQTPIGLIRVIRVLLVPTETVGTRVFPVSGHKTLAYQPGKTGTKPWIPGQDRAQEYSQYSGSSTKPRLTGFSWM